MFYTPLPQRGVIRLSGADVIEFLQGLVSNDVRPVKEGRAVYGALLSPQGKFLHDFFLVPRGGDILLDCDASRLPDLLARLKMYRLRSKVTIDALPEMGVAATYSPPCAGISGSSAVLPDIPARCGDVVLYPDPRLPQLGWRVIGDGKAVEGLGEKSTADAYDRMRLELGVPDGALDMIADKSLLLEFGFEDLHGVDFKKGCYVGQEVTARSKFRGQVRKFIYQVHGDGELPAPGTPVTLAGAPAGEMRSHAGNIGLALLRVAEANGTELVCGDRRLEVRLPAWVSQPPKALVIEE